MPKVDRCFPVLGILPVRPYRRSCRVYHFYAIIGRYDRFGLALPGRTSRSRKTGPTILSEKTPHLTKFKALAADWRMGAFATMQSDRQGCLGDPGAIHSQVCDGSDVCRDSRGTH